LGGYSGGGRLMSSSRVCAFRALAVAAVLALPAAGQSVISARSGVVHFIEGAVFLGDQPLESRLGKFTCMAEGAELRTAKGRAEVLLTPGVFLRMDENSAIRLVGNDLADTRVELLAGSALVDAAAPGSGTSVTLIYGDWKVHFLQKGVYRVDAAPPRVWVRQGQAEVSSGDTEPPVSVEPGTYLPLAEVLVPERSIDLPGDALSDWAQGRSQSISADDAIAAQIDEDPSAVDPITGLDGFISFPLIGVTSPIVGLSGGYGSYNLYQPGFNSIYLPGYTYRPLVLGLTLGGYGSYLRPLSPSRFGITPGLGTGIITPHLPAPLPRPVIGHPVVTRPAPSVGVHVGGRH
jgi:hypothetical protein